MHPGKYQNVCPKQANNTTSNTRVIYIGSNLENVEIRLASVSVIVVDIDDPNKTSSPVCVIFELR